MITLILTRHGETTWNKWGKIQGSSDNSILTKKGREQARSVAERLVAIGVDVIYSSELKRAKQTASIIAKKLEKRVQTTKNLNERSFGELEGKDVESVFGKLKKLPIGERLEYRPKGGESIIDVETRVFEEVEKIIERHQGEAVLLVIHGGVIKVLIPFIKKFPRDKRIDVKIENTSLTIFKIQEDSILEELINDISHLKEDLL